MEKYIIIITFSYKNGFAQIFLKDSIYYLESIYIALVLAKICWINSSSSGRFGTRKKAIGLGYFRNLFF